VERGTIRVKCLVQDHSKTSPPGLEPILLDPKSNALRPTRLQNKAGNYVQIMSTTLNSVSNGINILLTCQLTQ